jgi:hypothetical protein
MSDRINFAVDFYNSCSRGFEQLSGEAQSCMRQTIVSSQHTSGLFVGRHDAGDLYYTFFGLILSAISNAKIDLRACTRALTNIDFNSLDLVHGCAWLRCQRLLQFLSLPRLIRSKAIAYSTVKADRVQNQHIQWLSKLPASAFPQSDPNAPYSQFLQTTLHADFGLDFETANIKRYRLQSGLYTNFKDDSAYAVNATASALFLISGNDRVQTAMALRDLQEADGSFKAIENAPNKDLLSTGTAIFALSQCGYPAMCSAKSFLRDCVRENGLFAATADDPGSDLEYTVYALLALGGSA